MADPMLLLGVDTCGPTGSVALASLTEERLDPLGEIELAGRSYSATLVSAAAELLHRAGTLLTQVSAIIVVNGPGSFTGVRVGLSAVKGLAEPASIPVVPVSRLEVLAKKAGAPSAALDAHRHEVFLRLAAKGSHARELLAGRGDLILLDPPEGQIAVCDDSTVELLIGAWPQASLFRTDPPQAMDALRLATSSVLAHQFMELALLDGHYLRRSDAEILGESQAAMERPE